MSGLKRSSIILQRNAARCAMVVLLLAIGSLGTGCTGPDGGGGGGISLFGQSGAPWTILCTEMAGPYRMQYVEHYAQGLRRTPGLDSDAVFYMDHSDGTARLYYGTYYRKTDSSGSRSTPPDLARDVRIIKDLSVEGTHRPFAQALIVRKPQPDAGHPEWLLTKAPGKYSLQVAAFVPTDDFVEYKEAAAQYCELLRSKGYEAYYHHGPSCSIVTVGSFGEDAIRYRKMQLGGGPYVEEPYYSPEVVALQKKETFSENLVNGGKVRSRINGKRAAPAASQLVPIPRLEEWE
jgi:hypothetical protein